MTSSFALQLSKLQSQESRFQSEKTQASLLFAFQESAGFSIDTVHAIAFSGFLKMEAINTSYTPFKDLFDDAHKRIDREILTPTENEALQKRLKQFLLIVSCDFLNPNAQKVLEYLLRNFEVSL